MSVTCDGSVFFSGYSCFLHQWNWPPWYNWNIIESGAKHHKTNQDFIEIRKSFEHTVSTFMNTHRIYALLKIIFPETLHQHAKTLFTTWIWRDQHALAKIFYCIHRHKYAPDFPHIRNYLLSNDKNKTEIIPMFVSRNQFENNNIIEFTVQFDMMVLSKFVVKLEI